MKKVLFILLATASQWAAAAGHARISMEEARAIALKAYGGTVVEQELKREGTGLRYTFDIRAHRVTHEVAVDAESGKLLKNAPETEDDDD